MTNAGQISDQRRPPGLLTEFAKISSLFFLSLLVLWWTTARAYYAELQVYPDQFLDPIPLLPQLLFNNLFDSWVPSDIKLWVLAVAAFAVPPFFAAIPIRSRRGFQFAILLTAGLAGYGIWTVVDLWWGYQYVLGADYFPTMIKAIVRDGLWVLGLTFSGPALLIAGRRISRYQKSRRQGIHCSQCGYDLRVQATLPNPRCPECGQQMVT